VIVIDLNARVLSADHNVFVARPGKEFRLFHEIVPTENLLLEMPGLELISGRKLNDYTDLRARVLRSRAIRS
jgi:hypothetical protein